MLTITKPLLIAASIALTLISFLAGYAVGHYFGVKSGVKIEAGNNAIKDVKKQEKYREIRNNRPDAAGVIERLRAGTF